MVAGCGAIAPADEGIPHPRGALLVARMDTSGGFGPTEMLFTAIPQLTILGDGRVIVAHPGARTSRDRPSRTSRSAV